MTERVLWAALGLWIGFLVWGSQGAAQQAGKLSMPGADGMMNPIVGEPLSRVKRRCGRCGG